MTVSCRCKHCDQVTFVVDVTNSSKAHAVTIDCCLCGQNSAFVIVKGQVTMEYALADDEYICPECLEVFEKGRTDEEALETARLQHNNPDLTLENTELICDDCFKKLIIPQLN